MDQRRRLFRCNGTDCTTGRHLPAVLDPTTGTKAVIPRDFMTSSIIMVDRTVIDGEKYGKRLMVMLIACFCVCCCSLERCLGCFMT